LSLRRQLFEWLQNNSGGELPSLPPSSGPLKSSVGTHSSRDEGTVVTLLASEIGGLLIVTEPEGRSRCRALTGLNSKVVRRRATALDRAYHRVREDPSSVDHELDRLAPWMYESFGAAIEELVPEGEAVCVLACGSLAQLPLVAANCPERSTAYPLLTRPVRLLSRETARPVPAPFRRGLVIVGDTDTDVRTTSPASASVTRIAEAEAEGLGLLCELRQVDGISQRSIGGLLDEADLIHFACHGVSHPSDAARSRILLGGDRSLNVGDFLLSPLNAAPLVFLASCDTGRPDATLPDQTFGLVEALLLAGARMVIAPSRPVSRLASVIVSTRLYHGMSIGQTPDQALADAQRWLIGATDREIRVWLAATTSALRSRNCPWSSLGWLGSLFGGQENSPSRALQESGLLSFAAWT